MKRIEVTKEERGRLAVMFVSSEVMIWRALTYRVNTPKAQKIRTMALRHGGRIVDDAPLSCTSSAAKTCGVATFWRRA